MSVSRKAFERCVFPRFALLVATFTQAVTVYSVLEERVHGLLGNAT